MFSKIYWINEAPLGDNQLGTMARPRGNDWLDDEIRGLKNRGVAVLVSLLKNTVITALKLEKEGELCEKRGIEFLYLPISDVQVPANEKAFLELVNRLTGMVRENKSVVIHCRMGDWPGVYLSGGSLDTFRWASPRRV